MKIKPLKPPKPPKRSVNVWPLGRGPAPRREPKLPPLPKSPTRDERNMRAQRPFRELERDMARVSAATATEAGVRP